MDINNDKAPNSTPDTLCPMTWREIRDQIDLRLEQIGLPLDTLIRVVLITPTDTRISLLVEEGRDPVTVVITGR